MAPWWSSQTPARLTKDLFLLTAARSTSVGATSKWCHVALAVNCQAPLQKSTQTRCSAPLALRGAWPKRTLTARSVYIMKPLPAAPSWHSTLVPGAPSVRSQSRGTSRAKAPGAFSLVPSAQALPLQGLPPVLSEAGGGVVEAAPAVAVMSRGLLHSKRSGASSPKEHPSRSTLGTKGSAQCGVQKPPWRTTADPSAQGCSAALMTLRGSVQAREGTS
mmetsp:Transcript_81290/g.250931  ORF Transcript_81290/g.250931 Transcript_81290/m.250931 type:complete len:218 (+) Transcript_81290:68-721(+)